MEWKRRRQYRRPRRKSSLSNSIREWAEAINESKKLVNALDGLVETILDKINKRVGSEIELVGEVVEYEDRIEITQEVGIGVKPKIEYDGNTILVKVDGKETPYEVGCIDEESIEASVRNGVLSVKARRCKDGSDREDKGDI